MASKLSSFLADLRRRKVYRAGALYVVVGLGVIAAAEGILPPLGLEQLQSAIVVLVLLGLPVALSLAWAYELKPEEPRSVEPPLEGPPPAPISAKPAEIAAREQRKSIVVLPFDNMSPDPGDAYFADGLTEEIITHLSFIRSLRVISRNSAMVLKGTHKDTRAIARELDVQYVLEGSVRKAGNDLRITAQLIDGFLDEHLWAEKYDGYLGEIFRLQEEVSSAIAEALQLTITPEESARLTERPVEEVIAWEAYLRARYELYRLNEDGLHRAIREAKRGLEIAPENPWLLSILGSSYFQMVNIGLEDSSLLDGVEEIASRILEQDPDSASGFRLRSVVHYKRGQMYEAIQSAELALERDPHDPETPGYLNYWYGDVGRIGDMGPLVQRLIEESPLEVMTWWAQGWRHLMYGDFDAAAVAFEKMIRMEPGHAIGHLSCGLALVFGGKSSDACKMLEPLDEQGPESSWHWIGRHIRAAITQGNTAPPGDPQEEAQAHLWSDELLSWITAGGYAKMGQVEEATQWLEHAADLGFVNYPFLKDLDPFFAGIKEEPRVDHLLERVRREWEGFQA